MTCTQIALLNNIIGSLSLTLVVLSKPLPFPYIHVHVSQTPLPPPHIPRFTSIPASDSVIAANIKSMCCNARVLPFVSETHAYHYPTGAHAIDHPPMACWHQTSVAHTTTLYCMPISLQYTRIQIASLIHSNTHPGPSPTTYMIITYPTRAAGFYWPV